MNKSREFPTWLLVVAIIAGPWVLLAGALLLYVRVNTTDYSVLPPQPVFQRVFRRPLPPGATDLRVAGHGFWAAHNVCMSFRASDAAIDVFLSGLDIQKFTAGEAERSSTMRMARGELGRQEARDLRAVGWHEIRWGPGATLYSFSATRGGQGWFGELAVDRKRGFVYVRAEFL